MSRRLSSSQRLPVYQPTKDNPYQATTVTSFPIPHCYNQQNVIPCAKENFNDVCSSSYSVRGFCNNVATYEGGFSDDTCSDTNTYYDYHPYGYHQFACKKELQINNDKSRMPRPVCDEVSVKRFSRNTFREQSFGKKSENIKDPRKVFPKHESFKRNTGDVVPPQINQSFHLPTSRLSDRPQSSLSSGVTSAIVDGCGGHCQTFENVCYYFLQVAFTMGILIGTSLSIAGAVLRKSAARNLQVLVYIGALLSMVSALLLAIQCSARYSARKRKKAVRNAKRAPIPLDILNARPAVLQQQPLISEHPQRASAIHVQVPGAHQSSLSEHQGIPWWRRKDLN